MSLGLFALGVLIILAVIAIWVQRYEQKQMLSSGILEIDRMLGTTFERYLVAVFRQLGHQVQHTGRIGDYGADLVIARNGERTIVQAKRWNRKVGVRAIQEAVAAKGMYGCTAAMVVTNSFYTEQAKTLARANGVELWDRSQLVRMLQLLQQAEQTPPGVRVDGESATDAPAATYDPHLAASASPVVRCAYCGTAVSTKVQQYCEANTARFNGAIYCYDHQRSRPT